MAPISAHAVARDSPLGPALAFVFVGVSSVVSIPAAMAAPGVGARLGGAEAQGPAAAAVTGLHHNPAMLAALPGIQISSSFRAGVDISTVHRFETDQEGHPASAFTDQVTMVNPAGGYFLGASFQLDPIAIGAGVYDLSSRYRPFSADALRYHLASDPDIGCGSDPRTPCPGLRSGGASEIRHDYTVALARTFLGRLRLGASFHFPRLRVHLARDSDTKLLAHGQDAPACKVEDVDVEDPRCAERLSFSGRARLRWFGLSRNPSTRFDFAATFGVAFDVGDRGTVGLRYRTQPVLNRGEIGIAGDAKVCLGEEAFSAAGETPHLPSCTLAPTVQAQMTQHLPREAALGVAWTLGDRRQWEIDSNMYWVDACPGGRSIDSCGHRDARHLSLAGLDQGAAILPELELYRGLQDMFGTELSARYDVWKVLSPKSRREKIPPRVSLLLGAGFVSPGVRPGAITALGDDGWTLSANLGTRIEILRRHGSVLLVPGYGLDVLVPQRIGPGGTEPVFDPEAALQFEASSADINSPAADAVLHGRAHPTNAGVYSGTAHVLMLALRWAERGPPRRR